MEDFNIFMDNDVAPDEKSLANALGNTHALWDEISDYVCSEQPTAMKEWKFSGLKYGWSLRIKGPKRVIVYMLPRENLFKVAFVFGQKATDIILKSKVSSPIKTQLRTAKAYAEGRGIRIEIKKKSQLTDIKFLINTKLAN